MVTVSLTVDLVTSKLVIVLTVSLGLHNYGNKRTTFNDDEATKSTVGHCRLGHSEVV